jgi:hypothetical protein
VLAHPYLVRKGLPTTAGLVHQGYLIVPMWVEKRLVNVQRISADGEKRFLTGGRAKDAVYRIGREDAREVWLVEGYATGLSLHLALHAMFRDAAVVVCFSAGNLRALRRHARHGRRRSRRPRGCGAHGLPTARCPDGMDANDVHVNGGLARAARAGEVRHDVATNGGARGGRTTTTVRASE